MTLMATMSLAEATRARLTQSTSEWTAATGGRADGRLGNASQVRGRQEERASAAPSRWPSEAIGDPALSRAHAPVVASAPTGIIELRIIELRRENQRKDEHPMDMKISSCQIDGAQEQQGSIDGTDV